MAVQVLRSTHMSYEKKEALGAVDDHEEIEKLFPATYGQARIVLTTSDAPAASSPKRVGVVLSGGQAPGGHNVICGIYDFLKRLSPESVILGFLDGPQGIYTGKYTIFSDAFINSYRNSGGFDMIGSGRHKIEKAEHFAASMTYCLELDLDGLVIIGGDDSNTNAALLAEYFQANGCKTVVCGVPKTIDGDLKVHPYIPVSFGFDTACRTYCELIGNIAQDTLSTQKYYHFIRLMGRAASNIALECALQTRPNVCLISEEVQAKHSTLTDVTNYIADVICERSKHNRDYGLILLPEGLIEFIPEFNALIAEINEIMSSENASNLNNIEAVMAELSFNNRAVFSYLPTNIKQQLLLDRDPHGNVQVAKIETEKLLAQTVAMEIEHRKKHKKYSGTFTPQFHSFGYEGRSCMPSLFDATYTYALGSTAASIIAMGLNGYIASVRELTLPVEQWQCGGVPITMMCHLERRHGHMKPVIKKALVELDDVPFKTFAAQREQWAHYDLYSSPGPLQLQHKEEAHLELNITLALELLKSDPRVNICNIQAAIEHQKKAKQCGKFVHTPVVSDTRAMLSSFQIFRTQYKPQLCPSLRNATSRPQQATQSKHTAELQHLFPLTYGSPLIYLQPGDVAADKRPKTAHPGPLGVVFCGRQSPGGHDVIAGALDACLSVYGSNIIGFIGGVDGLVAGHSVVITPELMATYRGQGGFDLLGRSVDRIKSSDYDAIIANCQRLQLRGLILLGGSRTHTDAAYLSEYMRSRCDVGVVAVPVHMGDGIRNQFVEGCVGFDTAAKVTAQIVGNNATDGASAKKYYYFHRLMGQEPSNLALEVALLTKPNYCLLAEEVYAKNMNLNDIVKSIADVVEARSKLGKNYGVVIIPEGILESIPELRMLIQELDAIVTSSHVSLLSVTDSIDRVSNSISEQLTMWSKALFQALPQYIQAQLLLERQSDNKIQLSQAETERLLAHFVDLELRYRAKKGQYKGSFSVICGFIGYQARGAPPTDFDVTYAYNLGYASALLLQQGHTGYCASISNLKDDVNQWHPLGVPLTAMLTVSEKHKVEIPASVVSLDSEAYQVYAAQREACSVDDLYENPGPVQYTGDIAQLRTTSLAVEKFDYLKDIEMLYAAVERITAMCRPGCSGKVVHIATKQLQALQEMIEVVEH